jgi:hypothetical protein
VKALIVMAGCLCLAGCISGPKDIVTAEIEIRHGTNVFRLKQPKDTTLKRASIDPYSGRVDLEGYTSTANAAALEAQRAQAEMIGAVMDRTVQTVDKLGAIAERLSGAPIPLRTNAPGK